MDELTTLTKGKLTLVSENSKPDLANLGTKNREDLTLRIPPEILMIIFGSINRRSRDLKQAIAVCGRWRAIIVQIPFLWTKIAVDLKGRDEVQAQKVLSHVDLFLSRASDLGLDVEWRTSGETKLDSLFYNLFVEKGTFNHWKTLTLEMGQHTVLPSAGLRQVDRFSNLEHLSLTSNPPPPFLNVINGTVTTKLRMLWLEAEFRYSINFLAEYGGMLRLIHELYVWKPSELPPVAFPPNIKKLHAYVLPQISMPHVQHVFLKKLSLRSFGAFQPDSLVTISITKSMSHADAGLMIALPNLLWLGLAGTSCLGIAAFKVPSLHTLSIYWQGEANPGFEGPFVTGVRCGFEAPKLVILYLNILLDSTSTRDVLAPFPDISRLSLYFPDEHHATNALSQVFPVRRSITICPILDCLNVFLKIPPHNVREWRHFVKETARNIGDPLETISSTWLGRRYYERFGTGGGRKVASIHPWRYVPGNAANASH